LTFKLVAINPQVAVTDAGGELLLYIQQKAFRLREDVRVFADRERTRLLYTLRANRVLDLRVAYQMADADGRPFGALRREGLRSIWKSRYDVEGADGTPAFHIQEDNPWVKVLDTFLGELPFVGALTGYFLHPSYTATRPDGTPAFRLTKQPAFFEGKFRLDRLVDLPPEDEVRGLLGLLMMVMLERVRG
ncbi:MAG TPA: hypothetical protein VD962_04490, partial [Rubricoccaceae bacterium]|nr:hypothetical protein [Rubricoccaceae bacterium]